MEVEKHWGRCPVLTSGFCTCTFKRVYTYLHVHTLGRKQTKDNVNVAWICLPLRRWHRVFFSFLCPSLTTMRAMQQIRLCLSPSQLTCWRRCAHHLSPLCLRHDACGPWTGPTKGAHCAFFLPSSPLSWYQAPELRNSSALLQKSFYSMQRSFMGNPWVISNKNLRIGTWGYLSVAHIYKTFVSLGRLII